MHSLDTFKASIQNVKALTTEINNSIKDKNYVLSNDLLVNRQKLLDDLLVIVINNELDKEVVFTFRELLEWVQKEDAPNIHLVAHERVERLNEIGLQRKKSNAIKMYNNSVDG